MCPNEPTSAPFDWSPAADYHWGEPLTSDQQGSPWCSPALAEGEIHLWCLDLSQAESELLEPEAATDVSTIPLADLNAEERQRALRFVRRRDGFRFASVRRALRRLLARYLNVAPLDVLLELGPQGKPQLAGRLAQTGLHFNVSHSADQALMGFRYHGPLGVDLEQERAEVDFDGVARLMFSPSEVDWLRSGDTVPKCRSFYQIWSRKEAILKCVGWGLGGPRPTTSWNVAGRTPAHWPLHQLQSIPGYDATRPRLLLVDLPEALAATPAACGMTSGPQPLNGYAASVAAWWDPAATSICLRLGYYSDLPSDVSSDFFAPGL
ncbi:MAG: 4'-phosphopantetheinyl transferase family protein [Planctomycetota bacterium]